MEEYVEDEFVDGEDESRGPILGQERSLSLQKGLNITKGPPLRTRGLRMLVFRQEECLLPMQACPS